MFTYEEVSAEDQVKFLPSCVTNLRSPSDLVNRINIKQYTKHEIALFEYQNDIKVVNIQTEKKLSSICVKTEKHISSVFTRIENTHFAALRVQENFSSVDQFNDIWLSINADIENVLQHISGMNNDLVKACEHLRINNIRSIMTSYFDKIKSNGVWDDAKLMKFLDNESRVLNQHFLENYRFYACVASNLKLSAVVKMLDYRREWEGLLLTWRDFLVQKNLAMVQEIVTSDEYMKSAEMESWRNDAFQLFKKDDTLIIDMYTEIFKGLPYNRKNLASFSHKVEQILENKSGIKYAYIDKSTIHYNMLIDKLERKLVSIKEFLFKEASCNEEQFMKTFSKYVGEGSESYEMISNKILTIDNREMTNNLKIMSDVHCTMMRFLYRICEIWGANAEKIKTERQALLSELKSCRDKHDNDAKLLEYVIDLSCKKITSISCVVKLGKLYDKVKLKLDELERNSTKLFSEMMTLISAYPQTCLNQIKEHESSMLKEIGLKKVVLDNMSTSNIMFQNKNRYVWISGQVFEKLSVIKTLSIPCTSGDDGATLKLEAENISKQLIEKASKIIVDNLSSNKKNHTKTSQILVAKLENEISKEKMLRKSIHEPRKHIVMEEFESRKEQLNKFKETFEQFYECAVQFEIQLNNAEERFTQDANTVIASVDKAVEEACQKQVKITKSQTLIDDHGKVESALWKLERKIPDVLKSVLSSIDKDAKALRKHEDTFAEFAENGNYDFGEKSKFYYEFTEIKDRVRTLILQSKRSIRQQECTKNKKIVAIIQNYKTHYKHCLLGLYFIEMKAVHLARVRVKIKCASSYGDKDFSEVKSLVKDLKKSITDFHKCQPTEFTTHVTDLASNFIKGFEMTKKVINFLNYRCSPISVPAKNSLVELNQKYQNFSSDDPSLSDTIDFTKNILQMSSHSRQCTKTQSCLDNSDKNWLADRTVVEKKYITGTLACVYGVGANILDIPNHPWANVCSTLTSASTNSFWLSKNPEGLQALKDIREKKSTKNMSDSISSVSSANSEENHSRMKEISLKIRKLIAPTIQANLYGTKVEEENTRKSQQLQIIVEGSDETNKDEETNTTTSEPKVISLSNLNVKRTNTNINVSLPAIPAISATAIKDSYSASDSRKYSCNQMNMQKALNLNKAIGYLTHSANRRKRSSYFKRNQKVPIYDFLIISEEDLSNFVFETGSFFNLPKRKYNVDELCHTIVSIVEKVKFYLLHLQEDFFISCIIFYRQKHLSIKYPQRMWSNSDLAIDDFTSHLRGYLEDVQKQCEKNIIKVKHVLTLMYKTFQDTPSAIFERIYNEASNSFLHLYSVKLEKYKDILQESKSVKEHFFNCLRPSLAHPENESLLDGICNKENDSRAMDALETHYNETMEQLAAILKKFEARSQQCTEALIKAAESAIQLEDIRKITSNEENMFEVQKRLRQNLIITTASVSHPKTNRSTSLVRLVNYNKLHGTRSKLIISVLEERDRTVSAFKNMYFLKTEEFKSLHLKSSKGERDWHEKWDNSVKEVMALRNNEQ